MTNPARMMTILNRAEGTFCDPFKNFLFPIAIFPQNCDILAHFPVTQLATNSPETSR